MRIAESAVALHGTLGPACTTISALAEHAGVQRATVYRHFPDEAALYAACSAHWRSQNPLPDLSAWAEIENPSRRLEAGLRELYGFYRRNHPMIANLLRDEAAVPALTRLMAGFHDYLSAACDVLLAGRRPGHRPTLARAAVGHALSFFAWRSLALDQGLEDDEAARLLTRLVAAVEGF